MLQLLYSSATRPFLSALAFPAAVDVKSLSVTFSLFWIVHTAKSAMHMLSWPTVVAP